MNDAGSLAATAPKHARQNVLWAGLASLTAGIGLLVYSQLSCFTPPDRVALLPLAASRLAGLGLTAAGFFLLLRDGGLPWLPRVEQADRAQALSWKRWAALAGGLLLAVLASLLAGNGPKALSAAGSLTAWLAGIGLVTWAGWQGSFSRERDPRWLGLVAADLFVAALLLRVIGLQSIPAIFTGDESGFGRVAQQILRGDTNNLFSAPYMGGTNLPYLYDLIQAGALGLFGRSAWAFRLTSALAGALSVLAVFFVARRWFGRTAAVLAALLLAGNHLHLHFSRYAISNVFDGLFFVLALGLLWDAWESGERKKYLLAGLALGFSQFFYTSARALPLAALVFFAAGFLLERTRFKAALPSIGFYWAAFLAVFLPMILFYVQDPNAFIAPWSRVGQDTVKTAGLLSSFSPQNLPSTLVQVYKGLLGFTVLPLKWLYKPGVAVLRDFPALLFLLGITAVVARRKWSIVLVLGLWLAAFGFIGGLSDATPASQRYVGAAPALALLGGFGLSSTADLFKRAWPAGGRVILAAAVAAALFAAVDDARFYFDVYTVKERYSDPNGLAVQRLTDYLQAKDGTTQVVFVGYPSMEYTSIPTLSFLNPQITSVINVHNLEELEKALEQQAPHRVYFFTGGRGADLQRVMQARPGGVLTSEKNWTDEPVYFIYETGP